MQIHRKLYATSVSQRINNNQSSLQSITLHRLYKIFGVFQRVQYKSNTNTNTIQKLPILNWRFYVCVHAEEERERERKQKGMKKEKRKKSNFYYLMDIWETRWNILDWSCTSTLRRGIFVICSILLKASKWCEERQREKERERTKKKKLNCMRLLKQIGNRGDGIIMFVRQ